MVTIQKQSTPIHVQLITIEGTRPICEVIASLDEEINKTGSQETLRYFREDRSRAELVEKVMETLGDRDFMYFLSLPHGRWINKYFNTHAYPPAFMYTYGNPFNAADIMRQNRYAGLHLPLRLFITENERGGTQVVYLLPSSVVASGGDTEMTVAAQELDAKTEELVLKILSP